MRFDQTQRSPATNDDIRNFALWVIIGLVLIALFNLFQVSTGPRSSAPEIGYSQFLSDVEKGLVRSIVWSGQIVVGRYNDGDEFQTYQPNDSGLIKRLTDANVSFAVAHSPPAQPALWAYLFFPGSLILAVAAGLTAWRRRVATANKQASTRLRLLTLMSRELSENRESVAAALALQSESELTAVARNTPLRAAFWECILQTGDMRDVTDPDLLYTLSSAYRQLRWTKSAATELQPQPDAARQALVSAKDAIDAALRAISDASSDLLASRRHWWSRQKRA